LYYLLAVTRTISGGWYVGSIAAFTLISVVGGTRCLFFGREYSARQKLAMLAGVLYTVAPYHLNEIYQASLLSEYAACSALPFAFWVYRANL